MILIAHRGNTQGVDEAYENEPGYVDKAIEQGFDAEVDVWVVGQRLYLGHDEPRYHIQPEWLKARADKLWLHCKNVDAVIYFREWEHEVNYFWHESDTLTLTSKNYIWVYPGKQPIKNSIAVMPELYNDSIAHCLGVCSDWVQNYSN